MRGCWLRWWVCLCVRGGAHQISIPEGNHVIIREVVAVEHVQHALAHSLSLAPILAEVVHGDAIGSLRRKILNNPQRAVRAPIVDKREQHRRVVCLRITVHSAPCTVSGLNRRLAAGIGERGSAHRRAQAQAGAGEPRRR